MESVERPGSLLREAIESYPHVLSGKDVEEIQRRFEFSRWIGVADYMTVVVQRLTYANYGEDEFYDRLCRSLFDDTVIEADARPTALAVLLASPLLPYEHYDCLSMPDVKYDRRIDALGEPIERLLAIGRRLFAQRTERASAYLHVLDSVPSFEDRTVLLTVLMGICENAAGNEGPY